MKEFLSKLIEKPGVSGYEEKASQYVAELFSAYCDEVNTDPFYNVYGIKRGSGQESAPRVMVAAHMDEIGLMVKDIDDMGFLRFTSMGGVDQRILLTQEVTVHGKEDLKGIVAALPPHLLSAEEAGKAIKMKDLVIDLGLPADRVRELVEVGDLIRFNSPLVSMQGSFVNGKSIDDRAGVIMQVALMKELDKLKYQAEVCCAATVQEEVGTRGAIIGTYRLEPDIGIAIDVTHGDTPDAPKDFTHDMNKGIVIAMGPNMHPGLTQRLKDTAKEYGIAYQEEVVPGMTGTDARSMQISRAGVPTVLVQIPLRYMHTTVETLNMDHIKEGARLIALFIASLKEGWQEWLTY